MCIRDRYCENGSSVVDSKTKEILEVSLIPDDLSHKIISNVTEQTGGNLR